MTQGSLDHQWDRWQSAVAGQKLALGGRGDPPSGYYRRSAGGGRWEAFCVYRDDGGAIQCIRNMFGDGSKMSAGEIDEMFAGDVYPVSYEVYAAVAEGGQPWPEEYTTRLTTAEIKAGAVWTADLGRKKIEARAMAAQPAVAEIGHNSQNAAPHELLTARINDLADQRRAWLKDIGGMVTTQAHADKAADFAEAFGRLEKEAVETHKREKAPHLEAGRQVDATWKPIASLADTAKRDAKAMLTPYLRKQEEEAREIARRAAQEARERQAAAPAPVEPAKVRAGHSGRGVSLRTVSRAVIDDLPKVAAYFAAMDNPPADFVEACRTLAGKVMRSGVAVPGARIEESKEAA